MTKKKTLLVVLTGPTAVGKTTLSIDLAQYFQSEIISCDSRQFYREMNIGTAKVSNEEMQQVPHHFINHLSIEDNYNVSDYEQECIALLESLFEKHTILFLSGGSGLYIDAVCAGIDDLPDIDATLREELWQTYLEKGLEHIQALLEKKDPEYYAVVDKKNPTRLLRALEVCIQSGKKYSSLRKDKKKQRNFDILKSVTNALKENATFIFTTLNGLFPIFHSPEQFCNENSSEGVYQSQHFDLMTFRDYNIHTFTDDTGSKISLQCNERYYIPSEIRWLLKSLGWQKIDIYGAKLGAFSRNDKLTSDDYEMLVIAKKEGAKS